MEHLSLPELKHSSFAISVMIFVFEQSFISFLLRTFLINVFSRSRSSTQHFSHHLLELHLILGILSSLLLQELLSFPPSHSSSVWLMRLRGMDLSTHFLQLHPPPFLLLVRPPGSTILQKFLRFLRRWLCASGSGKGVPSVAESE
jgi:hypothetical protein